MSRVRTECIEGLIKRGKRGLDDKENTTNMKENKTIEERQTRPVNLCCHLHILRHFTNGTSNKLARQRQMIEIDVQSSVKGQGRESLQ